MRIYLILALVVFLISVAGALFSLWGIIVTSETTSYLKIEPFLFRIFWGTLTFFSFKIYLIWQGYQQYKQNNLPNAKTYFVVAFVLFALMLIVGMKMLNPNLF